MCTADQPMHMAESVLTQSHVDSTTLPRALPLIRGTELLCPRCETYNDVLWYEKWGEIARHAHETNPIMRCPKRKGGCGWIFSPADHAGRALIHNGRILPVLDV